MTCHVKRSDTGHLESMTFSCDHEGCAASPSDDEIMSMGGMQKMGWECAGGKHYCPVHRLTPAPVAEEHIDRKEAKSQ